MDSHFYRDLAWLPQPPADFSDRCRSALDSSELGREIRALASFGLASNQSLRLGRLIARANTENRSLEPLRPYRLGLLANYTVDFLMPALVASAARHGIALQCTAPSYAQAVQESLDPESRLNRSRSDAVLIAFDWRGFPLACDIGRPQDAAAVLDVCRNQIHTICNAVRSHTKANCIIQTIAVPPETLFGSLDRSVPGTLRNLIVQLNATIAEIATQPGFGLFDVAGLAETVGLANWHSPAQWQLAKLPFSQDFLPLYSEHAARLLAALCGNSRRCLVVDLDNTLWGGIIGDDGLQGIKIAQGDAVGEAFLEFQRYLLRLRDRGVVLAVSSKNEEANARLPFRSHPEMLLKENHFAAFQANWNDKPSNIRAIANALSLGLESLVFVDDNPFERALVRRTLPEVAVPEMPEDPALFARTLAAASLFESAAFSDEDRRRAGYYEDNARRAALQVESGNIDEYLASLRMEISFQPFDETGRSRIAQLINKSNQFNLTTRRYSEAEVEAMEKSPAYFTLQVRLTDAFGDNGMISVVICKEISPIEWEIDSWLMSCRVLGRRVEHMVLREMLSHASHRGILKLTGVYRPTSRNQLVANHYADLGFALKEQLPDGGSFWELDVRFAAVASAPMMVKSLFPAVAMQNAG